MNLNLAQVLFLLAVIWGAPQMSKEISIIGSSVLCIAGFAVWIFGKNEKK